jgi:hypothetical protein
MSYTLSDNSKSVDAVNAAFAQLADATATVLTADRGIKTHAETYIAIPETSSKAKAAELLTKAAAEEKQREPYSKTFNYRPWDIALSVQRVMKAYYGHAPFAVEGQTVQIEVPISHTESEKVPWGTFEMPEIKALITLDSTYDRKYGTVGQLSVSSPRMYHPVVEGWFRAIEEDLKVNSIYKNKAITSADMPTFLNPYVTKRDEIVWSKPVDASLRGALINVIRHTERARERGVKLHRSVLFYGEPGNGKSETINIVAQHCMENGWTYVMATTTLREALQTARLFAPAVIAAEDFERLIRSATDEERNELLEELDGTTSKGQEIMLVTTTNFIEDLEKAARRRMFKEIEFGPLDFEGIVRFLNLKLKGQAHEDLDYGYVAGLLDGWGNSYVAKVIDFATSLALSHEVPLITTADMIDAVDAQRPDWEGYQLAKSRREEDVFGNMFKTVVSQAVEGMLVKQNDEGDLSIQKYNS